MRKHWIGMVSTLLLAVGLQAQQLKTPAPSPTQTIKQDFGLSSIELSYSRPSIKDRTYFDDNSELAPVGNIWRTGANAATVITFNDDVKVGDSTLKAGKYGVLSIPGKEYFTFIITRQTDVTSPNAYKPEQDAVRYKAKVMKMQDKVETLTMQFANITARSCELHLMWGNVAAALPISQEIDGKIMKQIENLVIKDTRPYYAAAVYYMENGKDLNKAIEWFNKAAELNPTAYWIQTQRALCFYKMGKKEEALAAAKIASEMAAKEGNEEYVNKNKKLMNEINGKK